MPNTKTILAIDDDEDILYTFRQICNYQKWIAYTATCYEEAQQYLIKKDINLILLDYHMPEMDGIAVVHELRKFLPKVPIIVLTVEERDSIVERFIAAGANDYAIKPIKAPDLISRMKVHMHYSERSRYYEDHDKGISRITLKTIETFLSGRTDFVSNEDIETHTGVKRKTAYRYLQYLEREGRVELKYNYQDTGRPKTVYKLIR